MVRFHTLVVALTTATACGSGSQPSGQPGKPLPSQVAASLDAGLPAVIEPPKLACPTGTVATPATSPDPTWACTRGDGTRHGPFVTLFPDGTIAVRGAYADGLLDGAWERHHSSGEIAERGRYVRGHKDGTWEQLSPSGAVLGSYTLAAGSGIEKRWLDDGRPYSEVSLEASLPHGPSKILGRGGIASSARYAHGKLDGPHVVNTNAIRMEETFAAGMRVGGRKTWALGLLVAEENFDRKGRLDGPYVLWRKPKVPRVRGQFTHGKRDGAWVWTDRDSNKERDGSYLADHRDGDWHEYFENRLVWSGHYTDGKPDGDFVYFDRLGNELGRSTMTDGTGTMVTFHTNKKPSSKQRLVKGEPDGVYQELSFRGKVLVEGRYAHGVKHGVWKEFSSDGVPRLEETWKRGKLDGRLRKFVDGKVSTEATYAEGVANGPYAEFRLGKPAVTGQFASARKSGTWTHHGADGAVVLVATYKDGVLDGPWRQVESGAVVEGQLRAGRRAGVWTRTAGGQVSRITYPQTP